jgi:hypothetical protein
VFVFLFSIRFLFMPEGEPVEIELAGDLAGIPALAAGSKKPVSHGDGLAPRVCALTERGRDMLADGGC